MSKLCPMCGKEMEHVVSDDDIEWYECKEHGIPPEDEE